MENAEVMGGFSSRKLSEDDYEYDNFIWDDEAELCGEQKKSFQYASYALSTDDVYGDIYIKENYAVLVSELGDPMKWIAEEQEQYSLLVQFY